MSTSESNPSPDLRAALERLRKAGREAPKKITFDIEGADTEGVTELLAALVHAAELTPEERIEALASAFAVEAVRQHSMAGDAMKAHAKLRQEDDELAKAVETLAPWLLDRLSSRGDREAAVAAVEELLREHSN
jgi:hypothetical protein